MPIEKYKPAFNRHVFNDYMVGRVDQHGEPRKFHERVAWLHALGLLRRVSKSEPHLLQGERYVSTPD